MTIRSLAHLSCLHRRASATVVASAESASPRFISGASGPVVNVPWEEWGLYSPKDQAYITSIDHAHAGCGS